MTLAGAEIMCENLCCGLKDLGNEVIAVSFYSIETPITERLKNNGIKVYFLDKKKGIDLKIYSKIYRIIKEERPDCIHTHRYVMRYVIPVASLLNVPVRIHTLHSIASKENTSLGIMLNFVFYKLFKVKPVALTQIVQQTATSTYHISSRKIPIIYNGIDIEKFYPKTDYYLKDCFEIIHVGRFQDVKNHKLIIDAFNKLHKYSSSFKLKLIGDGPLFDSIVEYSKSLSLNSYITFTGSISDVRLHLHDSDLFILPSQYEGMPMTLIEAMATHLPIIASNVGGIPDMLINEIEALLITPSVDCLYNSVIRIFNDAGLRAKLGRNAGVRVKEFSSKTMAKEYLNLYKSCK